MNLLNNPSEQKRREQHPEEGFGQELPHFPQFLDKLVGKFSDNFKWDKYHDPGTEFSPKSFLLFLDPEGTSVTFH